MSNTKSKKHFILAMPVGANLWIHICIVALSIFGTVMIGSASMGLVVGDNKYLLFTVIKQIIFVIAGYIAMAVLANKFTINSLKKKSFLIVIGITFAALLACLLFEGVDGSQAWLRFSILGQEVTIQPSEFAKITSILVVAAYLGDVKKRFEHSRSLFLPPLLILLGIFAVVLLFQSDFGSAMIIFLISCICILIPNHDQLRGLQITLKVLFWIFLPLAIFILTPSGEKFINMLPIKQYQKDRFLAAFNPFNDKYNTGYQLVNSLISFASGGFLGSGFGTSIRKYTNFPAANTDYILAILVEELGFAGFFALMALYGVILFQLLKYASRMQNERGKIILVGTAMYLLIHMIFNIGGVTGLIPLTGVPLLMISSGGSATMAFMACLGISQAVISAKERGEIK